MNNIFELINRLSNSAKDIGLLVLILLLSGFIFFIIISFINPVIIRFVKKTRSNLDDALLKKSYLNFLPLFPIALIFYFTKNFFTVIPPGFIERIGSACIALFFMISISSVVDFLSNFISNLDEDKKIQIQSLSQALRLFIYSIGIILIISIFLDIKFLAIVSSLGALTAIILLVFRDSILGLVAGIQLSANKMVKINDWIEISSLGVDGSVLEVNLTTVKVQNWDKSVIYLPTYSLISKSFKNWHTMQELGARRIKRRLAIDMASVRFLSKEEIKKYLYNLNDLNFKKATEDSFPEFVYDENITKTTANKANVEKKPGRIIEKIFDLGENTLSRYTTAGFYRVYCLYYLRQHPLVRNDLTIMVRLLQPTSLGLGMEIYCFTATSDWGYYESIQAEVIENLIAAAKIFSLNIFQEASGHDFKAAFSQERIK